MLHSRPLLLSASLIAALFLAGCNQKQADKGGGAPAVKPEVSVMALHPTSVAVTATLPGRTAASLIAEVRPQVGGIIRKRNFQEGGSVKEGDTLYEIDPATYQAAYDSAAAALAKAEGAIPSAQAKVDRYKGLSQRDAVSQQDLDTAQATLVQAQADVASAKAALETARINLDYTKIRAPIGGRVGASTVTVGALVTADQTTALTTIRQIDPINVDVIQSSVNLLKLRRAIDEGRLKTTGGNVSVRLTLEDGSQYGDTGRIEFLDAAVEETTGTVRLRAEFPNADQLLLPGVYVRATIQEGIRQNSFLVPQRAVSRNAKGEPMAKFVGADGKVEERVLATERSVGNSWLVAQGIKDNERVVVEGMQRVRAGQEVTASEVIVNDATGELEQAADGNSTPAPEKQASAAPAAAAASK
ncbi:efflux transporter periplasmic adaptor subunit [Xaviernesmea oryzae]|uniref:Efflux transporter periplasmic adaptor subunit n=1 Tax=Xaviernesmea oryzae TaxID=464029 RepID=A0A1Q9B1R2_9HYPH|nr:efflux RND transporter periplasmic adaptor subunit [Xaviernesmea oryzae]OLP61928.1 efflux transporter periplasmic adaptor subunit [Xaviernesmea oryzae]SEL01115.1 membrane fusion protein, multidrug efflux system [Xaviernesmea oryzae]